MIQLTYRDEHILSLITERGWVSQKFLQRHFISKQAMLNRLKILRSENLIISEKVYTLLKHTNFKIPFSFFNKVISDNQSLYKVHNDVSQVFKFINDYL
jgi:hypothetical protein